MIQRNLKYLLVTLLVFLIAACTNLAPGNNLLINQGRVNNRPENFSELEKEYLFSTKALTTDYINRKLQKWLDENNGPKLVKEILFNIQKNPESLAEIFIGNQQLWSDINAVQAVQDRMAIDASFKAFLDRFSPGEILPPGLNFRITNTGNGAIVIFPNPTTMASLIAECGADLYNVYDMCEVNSTMDRGDQFQIRLVAYKMAEVEIYVDGILNETINTSGSENNVSVFYTSNPVPGNGNHLIEFKGVPWTEPENFLKFKIDDTGDGQILVKQGDITIVSSGSRQGINYNDNYKELAENFGAETTLNVSAFRMESVEVYVDGTLHETLSTSGLNDEVTTVATTLPGNGQHLIEFKGIRSSAPGDTLEFHITNIGSGFLLFTPNPPEIASMIGGCGSDQYENEFSPCDGVKTGGMGESVALRFVTYKMQSVEVYLDGSLFETFDTSATEFQAGSFNLSNTIPGYGQHSIEFRGNPVTDQ
jgi:hypothetical protein